MQATSNMSRSRISKRRRERQVKMLKQKLMGIGLILLSILVIYICSKGVTVQDRDATGVVLTLPLGIYLLFTRECWLLT